MDGSSTHAVEAEHSTDARLPAHAKQRAKSSLSCVADVNAERSVFVRLKPGRSTRLRPRTHAELATPVLAGAQPMTDVPKTALAAMLEQVADGAVSV